MTGVAEPVQVSLGKGEVESVLPLIVIVVVPRKNATPTTV